MRAGAATSQTNRSTFSGSNSEREKRWEEAVCLCVLSARRKSEGVNVHQPDDPAVDASSSQRQGPARAGQDVQPVHSRLDQLLRQLLSDAVASDPEEDRYLRHPLGAP